MATQYHEQHQMCIESQRNNYKLWLRNGWTIITIPCYGRSCMQPRGNKYCNVQCQYTHSCLDYTTSSVSFDYCGMTHHSNGATAQITSMLSVNVTSHRGKKERIHWQPITILWHSPRVVLPHYLQITKLFHSIFPLPLQTSWNVFQLHPDIAMHMISVSQMQHYTLDAWGRLPMVSKVIGPIGRSMLHLWDLTFIYRKHHSLGKSELSPDLLQELAEEPLVKDAKSNLAQSLAMSRPLARQMPWPSAPTR